METTVLLVDDHPLFRKGIRFLLEEEGDIRIAGEAGDGQAASPEELPVKIAHGVGHAIGGQDHIRIPEVTGLRVQEMQLHGPLP